MVVIGDNSVPECTLQDFLKRTFKPLRLAKIDLCRQDGVLTSLHIRPNTNPATDSVFGSIHRGIVPQIASAILGQS